MNRIKTTDILDPSVQQPFTGLSLDFLQNATKEAISGACISMIGVHYDATKAFVLYGLVAYGTNQYSAGYVYYGGELYYSPGKSSTTAFVNIPVMTITVANDPTADPVIFSDLTSKNVHNIRTLVMSDALTGTGTFDLADAIYINKWVAQSSPTFVARTNADVPVVGGVTGGWVYMINRKTNGISLFLRSVDADTLATVAKIEVALPISIPTPNGASTSAVGIAPVRFYKATTGIPAYVWINLGSSGSGTGLTIEKSDGSDFGALTNYNVEFTIDIDFVV